MNTNSDGNFSLVIILMFILLYWFFFFYFSLRISQVIKFFNPLPWKEKIRPSISFTLLLSTFYFLYATRLDILVILKLMKWNGPNDFFFYTNEKIS